MQIIRDIKSFIQYGDLPTSYYVKRGLKVGKNFNRQSGTRLDPNNCWLIEIGDDVIMSNKVQLVAHDFSTMHYTGYARFGKIKIGDRVFIGANSTILMNVNIGNDVIIGAGSLVNKDIPSGVVVAGVPARIICTTSEYIERQRQILSISPKYSKKDTTYGTKMTVVQQQKILLALDHSSHKSFFAKFRDYYFSLESQKIENL